MIFGVWVGVGWWVIIEGFIIRGCFMCLNLFVFFIVVSFGLVQVVYVVEGMWVLQQLLEIVGLLQKVGLKLFLQQLFNLIGDLMGVVVVFGGCIVSFVLLQGLVVINYYCVYGVIQLNLIVQKNLIKDGFNVLILKDELSVGLNVCVFVFDQIIDVIVQVKVVIVVVGNDLLVCSCVLDVFDKVQVVVCEVDVGFCCCLYSFFGGNIYCLFCNMEIKDVCLVYVFLGSVGKFGGDVDNWMWLCYIGDFLFYCVYVGKDGKLVVFVVDNVLYQFKYFLKFVDQLLGVDDFVMVVGYLGCINCYVLVGEFNEIVSFIYLIIVKYYNVVLKMIVDVGKVDVDVKVKYVVIVVSMNNVVKNYLGQLEGFKCIDVVGQKQVEEVVVLVWLKKQGVVGKLVLVVYVQLFKYLDISKLICECDLFVGQFNNILVVGVVIIFYCLLIECSKLDVECEVGYQECDLIIIEGGLKQMDCCYVVKMDQQLQVYWLEQYVVLLVVQCDNEVLNKWLVGSDVNVVKVLVGKLLGIEFGSLDVCLKWFKVDCVVFEVSSDLVIQYVVVVMLVLLKQEEQKKICEGELLIVCLLYLQVVVDYKKSQGEFVYLDVNLLLCIIFGNVMGYGKDGVKYILFIILEGVVVKEIGEDLFDLLKVLFDVVKVKCYGGLEDKCIGLVLVNFLFNLDIIGGNLGLLVLDVNGKLVGLVFDGNWELVSFNWVFDLVMICMIVVDSCYMQWIMQEVVLVLQLLKELNLVK